MRVKFVALVSCALTMMSMIAGCGTTPSAQAPTAPGNSLGGLPLTYEVSRTEAEIRQSGEPFDAQTNNCGSSTATQERFLRSRSFDKVVELGLSDTVTGEIGGGAVVAEATLSNAIGASLGIQVGSSETIEAERTIETPANSTGATKLQWEEVWTKGTIDIKRGDHSTVGSVPFSVLTNIRLTQISSQSTPCAQAATAAATTAPAVPTLQATAQPAAPTVVADQPTAAPAGDSSRLIEVNQTQLSDAQDFILIVRSVEILPDATMRWNVTFWNKRATDTAIALDYAASYVADENGNRYSVLGDSANTGPKDAFSTTLQPGVRADHSILFPAPIDNASLFTVGLVDKTCCVASWAPFSVRLKYQPLAAAPGPQATPAPAGAALIEVNQTVRSDFDNFILIIRSVELRADATMRWNLTFWNQTQQDVNIALDYAATYLADEFGHRYEVLGDSANTGPKDAFMQTIQPGVRLDHAIDFPAPRNGAKTFIVGLVDKTCCVASWQPFSTSLKYSPAPDPTPTIGPSAAGTRFVAVEKTFESDVAGFTLTVHAIEFLPDATARVYLSFWNQTAQDFDIGLTYQDTYVADENGNRFPVLSDSLNTGPKDMFNLTLQAGVRYEHSIDFQATKQDAKAITLGLVDGRCCVASWQPLTFALR